MIRRLKGSSIRYGALKMEVVRDFRIRLYVLKLNKLLSKVTNSTFQIVDMRRISRHGYRLYRYSIIRVLRVTFSSESYRLLAALILPTFVIMNA